MIQIKATDGEIYIIKNQGDRQEQSLTLSVQEALVLLNRPDALRDAIAQATKHGKDAREKKIAALEKELRELRAQDEPLPDPNAPAILVGRPRLVGGRG